MKTSKTKCKPGKTPTGKNGRCIKTRTAKKCNPGKTPSGKNGRCVKSTIPAAKVRQIIKDYVEHLDDPDFFSQSEINQFVSLSVKNQFTPSEIQEALDSYHKGHGKFV